MDYQNVVYLDDGNNGYIDYGRNAHAPVRVIPGSRTPRPSPAIVPASSTGTPLVGTFPSAAPPPYQYPVYYPPPLPQQIWAGYPQNPGYSYPPVVPPSNLASILGGFGDLGSLANIVAQAFAAFLPLPASPTPQDGTDNDSISQNTLANSSNLIRYQSALAQFARRDQQILTLGSVLKELLKRPGMAA